MSTIVMFRKGDVIYREGDFEMAMYCIREGAVLFYANYGKESEMLYEEMTEGSYFGQLELVDAVPRSATAIAKDDVVLEKILGEEFGSYFVEKPEEQMEILLQMSARLRAIGDQLHEVYITIDEYLSEEKKNDPSFLEILGRIIRFGRYHKEQEQ